MADYDNVEVQEAEEKAKAAEAAAEEARKEAERIAKKAKEEAEAKKKAEEAEKEAAAKEAAAKAEEEKKEADKRVQEAKAAAEAEAQKAEEAKKQAEAKKAEEDAAKAQAAAAAAAAAAQKQQEAAAAKEAKRKEKKAKIQALKDQCPAQYKPLGTSVYFWVGIFCWLPFIGILVTLILSIFPKNKNLKCFARSKLAYYIIIFIACLIITLVAGYVIPEDSKIEIGNALLKIMRSVGLAV